MDRRFIKERIKEGVITMTYVPSNQEVVNILTKGLPRQQFKDIVDKLGIINIYLSTSGGV